MSQCVTRWCSPPFFSLWIETPKSIQSLVRNRNKLKQHEEVTQGSHAWNIFRMLAVISQYGCQLMSSPRLLPLFLSFDFLPCSSILNQKKISPEISRVRVHWLSHILFQDHSVRMDHNYQYLLKILTNKFQCLSHMSPSLLEKKIREYEDFLETRRIKLMGCLHLLSC